MLNENDLPICQIAAVLIHYVPFAIINVGLIAKQVLGARRRWCKSKYVHWPSYSCPVVLSIQINVYLVLDWEVKK